MNLLTASSTLDSLHCKAAKRASYFKPPTNQCYCYIRLLVDAGGTGSPASEHTFLVRFLASQTFPTTALMHYELRETNHRINLDGWQLLSGQ